MPDDPPRPASGQQSDPRPTAGAPAWWGALGRPDLPLDGEEVPLTPVQPAPPAHSVLRRLSASRRPQLRWRTWAFNLAILAVAVLIVCVGIGVLSLSMFVTVALLFGVPLILAAVATTVVARRSR